MDLTRVISVYFLLSGDYMRSLMSKEQNLKAIPYQDILEVLSEFDQASISVEVVGLFG
jgi:hypothetical protein